eukprot:394373-Amphidinium_carterae.2
MRQTACGWMSCNCSDAGSGQHNHQKHVEDQPAVRSPQLSSVHISNALPSHHMQPRSHPHSRRTNLLLCHSPGTSPVQCSAKFPATQQMQAKTISKGSIAEPWHYLPLLSKMWWPSSHLPTFAHCAFVFFPWSPEEDLECFLHSFVDVFSYSCYKHPDLAEEKLIVMVSGSCIREVDLR